MSRTISELKNSEIESILNLIYMELKNRKSMGENNMGIFDKEKPTEQVKTDKIEVGKKKEIKDIVQENKIQEVELPKEEIEQPELTDSQRETISLIEYFRDNYGSLIQSDSDIKTTNALLFGVFSETVKLRVQIEELQKKEN